MDEYLNQYGTNELEDFSHLDLRIENLSPITTIAEPHYLTKMRYTFNLIILEILNLRIITQVIIFEPFLFYFFEYVQKLVSVTFRCWCVGLGVPISTHHHPKASVLYLLNICNDLGLLTLFFIKNINLYIYLLQEGRV